MLGHTEKLLITLLPNAPASVHNANKIDALRDGWRMKTKHIFQAHTKVVSQTVCNTKNSKNPEINPRIASNSSRTTVGDLLRVHTQKVINFRSQSGKKLPSESGKFTGKMYYTVSAFALTSNLLIATLAAASEMIN